MRERKVVSMSVSLATLPAGATGTRVLTMFCNDSYDPPGTTTKATKFRFRMVAKPGNALAATLENDGLKTGKSAVTLSLDDMAVGLYRITCDVWDAVDQQSAAPSELKINVSL